MNASIHIEKETAIQMEDKPVISDLSDAVSIATHKLKLVSSILFQTKAVNIVENILNYKNLLLVGKSGCGKTTLTKTATHALTELGYSMRTQSVFINAYSNEEFFGESNPKNRYFSWS